MPGVGSVIGTFYSRRPFVNVSVGLLAIVLLTRFYGAFTAHCPRYVRQTNAANRRAMTGIIRLNQTTRGRTRSALLFLDRLQSALQCGTEPQASPLDVGHSMCRRDDAWLVTGRFNVRLNT